MSLNDYHAKRDFDKTPEPKGTAEKEGSERIFVVHKHDATRLHYDLRLEADGVLKSWAVPKGPSLDPTEKRLAVQVEDHPLSYGDFEDIIPRGEYGAGEVIVWDRGTWQGPENAEKAIRAGKLKFELDGDKLKGGWTLVRMRGEGNEEGKNWLLIKEDDSFARKESDFSITEARPESVKSGRTLADLRAGIPADSPDADDWSARAKALSGAKLSGWPGFFAPQLATLTDTAPTGDKWIHEVKFDGYRLLAHLRNHHVKLFTRNENDWTHKFEGIRLAVEGLPVDNAILDGEVVALGPRGISSFQALQNQDERPTELFYYVFDLLYLDGVDLRRVPLIDRKHLLEALLNAAGQRALRYSRHTLGAGETVHQNACQMNLEGIVSKRKDSHYASSRTEDWKKIKCYHRQELVVGGFTEPKGGRTGFGALVLGYYDDTERLIYAGRVGTGFTDKELEQLARRLHGIEVEQTPFDEPPVGNQREDVHWVKPILVAEVQFIQWTDDNLVRQASFMGLREDKPPREVRQEKPKMAATEESSRRDSHQGNQSPGAAPSSADERTVFAGVHLTNPDRILWPEQGVTKRELASYYDDISDRILPYIADRPLSLLRCPRGADKKCFFQKNYTDSIEEPIDRVKLKDASGEEVTYLSVDDKAGLIQLAQLGTLELHPWGAKNDRLDRPDMVVFDLDPDTGMPWESVITAARRTKDILDELGLVSFVKTSGGKGLHVIAPLERRAGWDEVKDFAQGVAQKMAREYPGQYVATMSKSKRKGKIFVDYLRNSRGATSVAVYSTRARRGAPISTPLRWDELNTLDSSQAYTIDNIRYRLGQLSDDPWEGFFDQRQSVTKKMLEALGA